MTLKEDLELISVELGCERLSGEHSEHDALEALGRITAAIAEVEALNVIALWQKARSEFNGGDEDDDRLAVAELIPDRGLGHCITLKIWESKRGDRVRDFVGNTRREALKAAAKWCKANPCRD